MQDIEYNDISGKPDAGNNGTGYVRFDSGGRILAYDECYGNYFLKSAAEFRPGSFPQGLRSFSKAFELALKEGASAFTFRNKGNFFSGLFRCDLRRIHTENKTEVIGLVHPVTDTGLSSSDAQQASGYFGTIINSLKEVISLHDGRGHTLFVSEGITELTGYTPGEFAGISPGMLVSKEDSHRIGEMLRQISHSGSPQKVRFRFNCKSGESIWIESDFRFISGDNNAQPVTLVISRDVSGEKEAMDALARSEEKYRKLIMDLPTGVALLDREGRILEANNALLRMMGKESPAEGASLTGHPDALVNKAELMGAFSRALKTNEVITTEFESSATDAKSLSLIVSFMPLSFPDTGISYVLANIRDISAQKKIESEVKQQYEFLNFALNTMQGPFFMKDEEHRWLILNDAAVEMIGQPRDFLLGKSDYDVFPKEEADIFWEKDNYVFEHGSNINEEKITGAEGQERTIITAKNLYTDAITGKKFIVGTIHDITEIRKKEEAIRQSELKYKELFDNANDFIFFTDLEGRFTDVNEAMLKSLNLKKEQFLGVSIFDLTPPGTLEEVRMLHSRLIMGEVPEAFELKMNIPGEGPLIIELKVSLIQHNGQVAGVQGIARNVTGRKQEEERLQEFNRELTEVNAAKDKFYSIIAHDLKNPFNSLIGFSDLLLEDFEVLSKEEIREYVGIISRTAKNSLKLLENLLAWSRLQAGKMDFQPRKLNLHSELQALMNLLLSSSYRKHQVLNNRVKEDLFVKADDHMLAIILQNLLTNAIKFTADGGKIEISARVGDTDEEAGSRIPMVTVTVKDTGIGITDEIIDKLFSSARPVSTPGTGNETGTGLGLLLTKEMVEKHTGRIWVKSVPGEGSEFSFSIPLFVPQQD